ncbi:MAG: MFS transporter [Lentisphaeria bacterium]|nr:MFS transporter [Lentisphaeria bacterium]
MNAVPGSSGGWKGRISLFLAAQTVSLFGSSLVQYAIIWHITLSTLSGSMMTISTVCGFFPQIAISLFAGVWIDRHSRKRMIILADGAIALSTLTVALLFLAGYRELWLLFAVLAVRSAGTGIQTPAVNALIPQLVPPEKLMRVNGIYSTISSLMMFLSPAASAAILSVAALEATFFIDIVTAAAGIGILLFLAVPALPGTGEKRKTSNWEDIREGFRYLRNHALIRRLLVFLFALMVSISPAAFLTPLLVGRSFGDEVWRLSASEMTFSAGAAAGGLLIAAWGGFSSKVRTTVFAGSLYGLFMIGIGAAPLFWLYLAANFMIGVTMPCFNAPLTALLQEKVEPEMHGRVFSLVQVSNSCALPLGMVLFGPLADFFPVQALLVLAGGLVVALSAFAFRDRRFSA